MEADLLEVAEVEVVGYWGQWALRSCLSFSVLCKDPQETVDRCVWPFCFSSLASKTRHSFSADCSVSLWNRDPRQPLCWGPAPRKGRQAVHVVLGWSSQAGKEAPQHSSFPCISTWGKLPFHWKCRFSSYLHTAVDFSSFSVFCVYYLLLFLILT